MLKKKYIYKQQTSKEIKAIETSMRKKIASASVIRPCRFTAAGATICIAQTVLVIRYKLKIASMTQEQKGLGSSLQANSCLQHAVFLQMCTGSVNKNKGSAGCCCMHGPSTAHAVAPPLQEHMQRMDD